MYQLSNFSELVEASSIPTSVQGPLRASEPCRAKQTKCLLPRLAEVALGRWMEDLGPKKGRTSGLEASCLQQPRAAGVSPLGWLGSPHPRGVRAAGAQAARPVHVGDRGQLACPGLTTQRHCKVHESTMPPAASSGMLKHSCVGVWWAHGASPSSGGSTVDASGSLQTQGDSADPALKSSW